MAVRRLQRRHPGLLLVTGVNLPLLLEVAMSDNPDAVALARGALERGRAAMQGMGG